MLYAFSSMNLAGDASTKFPSLTSGFISFIISQTTLALTSPMDSWVTKKSFPVSLAVTLASSTMTNDHAPGSTKFFKVSVPAELTPSIRILDSVRAFWPFGPQRRTYLSYLSVVAISFQMNVVLIRNFLLTKEFEMPRSDTRGFRVLGF